MDTTRVANSRPTAGSVHADTTLPGLLKMDSRQLSALFRAARWQGAVRLSGHPHGHVLAVPGADRGVLGHVVRAATRGPFNPWQGKSFRTEGEGGSGTNRVGFGKRFGAFRFRTYETASVVDGEPALAIDYDVADNPAFARSTYDELRPVGPGLLLGRGMARRPGRDPRLLLWFALEIEREDTPVSW